MTVLTVRGLGTVAIKFLPAEAADDEIDEHERTTFIAMELVDCEPLDTLLKNGTAAIERAWAEQIASKTGLTPGERFRTKPGA